MSSQPEPDLLAVFADQARQEFSQLVQSVEAQGQQAQQMREQLGSLANGINALAQHRYAVFLNATTQRYVLLRDVDKLDGAGPVQHSQSFAAMLAWINAHPPQAPLPDEPLNPPLGPGPLGPLWPSLAVPGTRSPAASRPLTKPK